MQGRVKVPYIGQVQVYILFIAVQHKMRKTNKEEFQTSEEGSCCLSE